MSRWDRERRRPLAWGLLAIGVVLVAGACLWGSATPTTARSALLILGCDVIIAGLWLDAPAVVAGSAPGPLAISCVAETVFWAVFADAALLLVFGNSQPVARLGYFATLLVVVPAGVVLAWRRSAAGPSDGARSLTLLLLVAVSVVVTRLWSSAHVPLTLVVLVVVSRIVTEGLARAGVLARLPANDAGWWAAVPVVLALAALVFVPSSTLNLSNLAFAALIGLVAGWVIQRRWGRPAITRWGLDIGIVIATILVVVQLGGPSLITALNGNYFLGPVLDITHGQPILVDTFSQYGVGMFDGLAAVFSVVALGYGTFQLLLSVLTVLWWLVIYAVLRMSTRSQLIAALGLAVGVLLYLFGPVGVFDDYQSTGVLRFGMPWLVIVLSVASARSDAHVRRWLDAAVLVVVAVAAQWSGETAGYTLGTAVAIALLSAAVKPLSIRARARIAALAVLRLTVAFVAGLVLFSVVTRLATGHWPDWGPYLAFVRLYTSGGLGAVQIAQWSTGLAMAWAYAASATVLILLVILRPDLVRARLATFRAVAGLTVLGALVYTYFLGRADPNNLVHISPPLVVLGFVWLDVVNSALGDRRVAAVAGASLVFVGALVVAGVRPNISQRFGQSALGVVTEHPGRLATTFDTIKDNPVISSGSVTVEDFIRKLHIGHRPLLLAVMPIYETEALVRLDRANAVASSNPCQEALSPSGASRLLGRIRKLEPGGVLVTFANPEYGPLTAYQNYELTLLRARFDLKPLGPAGGPLVAYRLGPVTRTWNGGGGYPQPPAMRTTSAGCG